MTTQNFRSSDRASQSHIDNPQSRTIPRSQYAIGGRGSMHRPRAGQAGSRYFSAPFRAPLNQHDRHEPFVEHQKVAEQTQNEAVQAKSLKTYENEQSSYKFFDRSTNSGSLNQITSVQGEAGNTPTTHGRLQVMNASEIGHSADPTIRTENKGENKPVGNYSTTSRQTPSEAATIDALNAAISAALRNPEQTSYAMLSQKTGSSRAPPDSPTSTYSQEIHQSQQRNLTAGPRQISIDTDAVLHTPRRPQSETLSSLREYTPYSEKSSSSAKPLLGLGIENPGLSKRVPESMRPPPLNMKVVRDMESRGSITSLSDMIRRATRLAANLDRGKTASRLGIWDMFSNADMAVTRNRESTCTDVLDAFPDPAHGAPSKVPRPTTMWPKEPEVDHMTNEKQETQLRTRRRKCCGLSMTAFIILLVIIVLLIAAAVLIPIFLVAAQRHYRNSAGNLARCPDTHPCQNGGVSIVDNNACSCVCVGGFIGNDCSKPADPSCVTISLTDGSTTFVNATLGSSIVNLLIQAQGQMKIPLNTSVLLSTFSHNNLSCASENSLVNFDGINVQNKMRSVRVPDLGSDGGRVVENPVPGRLISTIAKTVIAPLIARQTAAKTGNNFAYQPTSTSNPATNVPATQATSIVSATPSISIDPLTAKTNITSNQLQFARLVVLYVLTGSRVPSTAVSAQQKIEQYFRAGALASGNTTVDVVHMDNVEITANFAQLVIVLSNGKVIGETSPNGR